MPIAVTRESGGATDTAVRFAPDRYAPRVSRWFRRYSSKKIAKSFFAVRLDRGSFDPADCGDRPVIAAITHTSWWDPLLMLALHERWFPHRRPTGPMDIDQLERFGFFKRLGIFGVDPQDPSSLEAMASHVRATYGRDRDAVLWITPQGEFADARADLRVRPGVAAIASSLDDPVVVVAACEYAFWLDQRPEIFLRLERAEPDGDSTTAWQRAIVRSMSSARDALAERVIARDASAFDVVLGKAVARTNPVWDVVMRLRGQSGSIEAKRRGA